MNALEVRAHAVMAAGGNIDQARAIETFIWGGLKPEDRPAIAPIDSLQALDVGVKKWLEGNDALASKVIPIWERFMADANQATQS